MLSNLRPDFGRETGFSLIELLVVMLIIGILAGIALPSYLGQRSKAYDGDAKASANSAQLAMESFASDRDAKYSGADAAALKAIEPTLADANGLAVDSATDTSFEVSVRSRSTTGTRFSIRHADDGTSHRACDHPGEGACPADGTW